MIYDMEAMFERNNMLAWIMHAAWGGLPGTVPPERVQRSVEIAKKYLAERHIHPEVQAVFLTGWCDGRWLIEELKSRNIPPRDIFYTGLLTENDNGEVWSPFDQRIIWPITTVDGKVAAFCGRTLTNDKRRKYLNSSDSKVYRKREIPFGLQQALPAILRTGRMIFVEGQLDVLAMHTMGIRETVAVCGSSPSYAHVMYAKWLSATAYCLFDGDEAGQRAGREMYRLCSNLKVPVKYATLAEGDPCDMLRHSDAAQRMGALLESATEELHGTTAKKEEAPRVYTRPDEGNDAASPVDTGDVESQTSLIPV